MRKGLRLISPEDQEVIAAVCRSHGWNGPLVYDGEQEEHYVLQLQCIQKSPSERL